jgi:hypothetical protein
VNRYATHLVACQFDLPCVQPYANLRAQVAYGCSRRQRASHGTDGAVKGDKEAVASSFYLLAAKACDLCTYPAMVDV